MVKLVDTRDSKSLDSDIMSVRVRPTVPFLDKIRGHAETGRQACLRGMYHFDVWVQVPLTAPSVCIYKIFFVAMEHVEMYPSG